MVVFTNEVKKRFADYVLENLDVTARSFISLSVLFFSNNRVILLLAQNVVQTIPKSSYKVPSAASPDCAHFV